MAKVTKVTPKKIEQFLEVLSNTADVTKAAETIGISRKTMYALRKKDESFAQAWAEAVELGTDALEDEAIRRGHKGVDKPVFQGKQLVGYVREYSDTLLMFMLKARRPDKFKDRVVNEHTGEGGGPIRRVDMTAEEFRQIAGDLVKDI